MTKILQLIDIPCRQMNLSSVQAVDLMYWICIITFGCAIGVTFSTKGGGGGGYLAKESCPNIVDHGGTAVADKIKTTYNRERKNQRCIEANLL